MTRRRLIAMVAALFFGPLLSSVLMRWVAWIGRFDVRPCLECASYIGLGFGFIAMVAVMSYPGEL